MSSPSSARGPRRILIRVMALGYGVFLGFVALWPRPIDESVGDSLSLAIQEGHERGVPGFVDHAFIEFGANILLFGPVGILCALLVGRRLWPVALLMGPALSGVIELVQKFLIEGRYGTVADVIANSIGATLGVLLVVVVWRKVKVPREQPERVVERQLN